MRRSSDYKNRIRENICPRCGRPSPDAGLCGICRAADLTWLSCDPRVTITLCPGCGSRREGGVWADCSAPRDEVAYDVARRSVHIAPEIVDRTVDLAIHEQSANRSVAECRVSGSLFGQQVEGSCQTEIIWEKEQCDRCSRMSGSYYEGVVQVRAVGRKPRPAEIRAASQIARDVEESCFSSGERLSFISDMEETRDGLDITVGSQRIGQEIASAIVQRLGGRFSTHPKLVGERAGKRLYRITYSVRLSAFMKGDIILVRGRYGEVMSTDGRELRYREIPGHTLRTISENRVERGAGNICDANEYLVTFRQGDTIGLLDSATGKSIECPLPPGMLVEPGEKVLAIRDEERIILIGKA